MRTCIVTGSQGFIGSYLCQELLKHGWKVIGIDNFSKYGRVSRPHDTHYGFTLIEHDLSVSFPEVKGDYIIAGAAMIGGISYFHKYAYDLLAHNERIIANTFDKAIKDKVKRVLVISSSMVYENTDVYPTPENSLETTPPPMSTYGFQKLAVEYFAKGAWEQHGIPYTIVRPFNCVGVGEEKAITGDEIMSGNIKLMLSHVLPDLINKVRKGQNPLRILGEGNQVRCYTNGKDIARGIRLALESEVAINNDFNISTSEATTVLELAEKVWSKLNPDLPFKFTSDKPYNYDVQKRIPCTRKAKEILNFESEVSLDESIEEVINYMENLNE